jgi:A/G-specific adenine glycosylase
MGGAVTRKNSSIFEVNMDFDRQKKEFVDRLLQWYELNKRAFSWRKRELTPYQVLILELMLQRTPAQRVEKVFENFIKKFPNPITLHSASDIELESIIQTLGLQKRRRELLKDLAEYLVKKHDGRVPVGRDELLKLPGVGIYVASAVMCYCYGKPVPLIDTNAARVLGRIFGLPSRGDPSTEKHLWIFAEHVLPKSGAKSFNWALIDFGALVCKPKNPRCSECPMCDICKWFLERQNQNRAK